MTAFHRPEFGGIQREVSLMGAHGPTRKGPALTRSRRRRIRRSTACMDSTLARLVNSRGSSRS